MWQNYYSVTSIDEALRLLAEHGERARLVAGATDLLLEIERGVRKGIETLIDVSRIPKQDLVILDEDNVIHLGPLVTHNHCVASKLLVERGLPLAQAAWEVGAPQIRNRGTVAGNLITASPANDTISPLLALGASVTLRSLKGERRVPLAEFYTGVRKTVLRSDEMLVDIAFPALAQNQCGAFIKLGLRRAQAISVVNAAVVLTLAGDELQPLAARPVLQASITLGSVTPVIGHAAEAEAYLVGKKLDEAVIEEAAHLAQNAAHPIGDVRSPADYRLEMVRVCVARLLRSLVVGEERANFPENPVLLWGKNLTGQASTLPASQAHPAGAPIVTRINGQLTTLTAGAHHSLLHLLREQAGLTGTKEGCGEGECGACTVFLDGVAVMSCLVPAPRAHGAEIVTVEGLAQGDQLHPVQQAFIDAGAVQCGYCTPGFLMSAASLLAERPAPSRAEVQAAIAGNLCRCTGYYKIVEAIERAAVRLPENGGSPTPAD
jgi:carbon-monoxide dehydrogenase medium subunit